MKMKTIQIKKRFKRKRIYSIIIYNSQKVEATQMFMMDEWINKMRFMHQWNTIHP